jgi:type IV pilus assembly protein PilN
MRVTLNLASRPFFELRPLLMRLRAIAAGLVVLAIILFTLLRSAENKATRAQANVHDWTVKTQNLQQEWQRDQLLMREPQNAATLERAQFLNDQFTLKSFSWTTALMDLEKVLPQGVQVISIDPQMTKEGQVIVRLRVDGPRDKAVELVANLEKSPHFLHPMVAGETAEIEGQNRAGFRPTMSYSTDVNVTILAEFNAGDLAEADVKAEEKKSGTADHSKMETASPAQTTTAATAVHRAGGGR